MTARPQPEGGLNQTTRPAYGQTLSYGLDNARALSGRSSVNCRHEGFMVRSLHGHGSVLAENRAR